MSWLITIAAWRAQTGWTAWHILRRDGQRTLCGLPVPRQHLEVGKVHDVCAHCGRVFLEPLI